MTFATFGDLASAFQSRHMNAQLKRDMTRLGIELTTGQKADLAVAVSGDFGPIAGIDHTLSLLVAYKQSTNEASLMVGAAQTAMGNFQEQTQDLSAALIGAVSSQNSVLVQTTANDAREKFSAIVASLNSAVGGRAIFAGAATDGPAVVGAKTILSELAVAIAGETTAAGVSSRIDEWFLTPGGGFETTAYLGASTDLGSFRLRDGERVTQSIKASDAEIREMLSAFAKSAIIAEGALTGDVQGQKELAKMSSEGLLAASDDLTFARARVGVLEARIEAVSVRNASEKSALELSRNEIVAADPYETATALKAAHSQLQSLYTVTATLSNLSFTDYMR
ncbi:flagellin [Aliiroseovarius sp. 2305UL8-7]|uniref:flagellin n=1 Tax=Aliiroseovarius conchicola TaxID=3121637 RepID=UPI00352831E2